MIRCKNRLKCQKSIFLKFFLTSFLLLSFLGTFTLVISVEGNISRDSRQLLYSTFFGTELDDGVLSVARDHDNNLIFAGFTSSPDFPTTTGAFHAFRTALQAR